MIRFSNILISFLLICVFVSPTYAQDIHFSQFGYAPLNTNPANTGLFDGDYRVGGNYRTQWWEVPGLPYTTFSCFGDMRQEGKKLGSDRLGLGFLMNYDVAGESRYGTTQLYLPLSYVRKVNEDSTLLASVGISPGISSTGFKTDNLTFDSQYDGLQYNSTLSSQENFSAFNQTKFDLNLGAMSQYTFMPRGIIQFGFSAYHLLPQNVTYFNNQSIVLDRKVSVFGQVNYPLHPSFDINAELLYSRQGKFQELLAGANFRYLFPTKHHQAIFAGVFNRWKDAFISRVGMEYKDWRFSMAYDLNTSAFRAATNRYGSMEFGLIYILRKKVNFIVKKRVCPIYM